MSPAKGHLNASFGLARIVAQDGYSIVYAAPFELHSYISQQGFECIPFAGLPFGVSGEEMLDSISNSSRVKYLDNLIDRFYDTIYKARKLAIEQLIKQAKPRLMLLDSFQSTDFILLYPLLKAKKIKFAFIQTMLSFHQQPDNLPLDCDVIPNLKTSFIWYWRIYYLKRRLRSLWQYLIYFSKNNKQIINNKVKIQKIEALYSLDYQQVFGVGFKNIPELIIAPQMLEFTKLKKTNQHYLGLMVDLERSESTHPSLETFVQNSSEYNKIIYCSFGTLYGDVGNKKQVIGFFRNLILAAKQLPEYEFIISLSKKFEAELNNLAVNVHIFETIPQILILKISSLFITHGGLNSIKESLALGVPMLVYPVDKRWDQPSNAAKIAFHGLGLSGSLEKDSPDDISQKISELLDNQMFSQRISSFKNAEDERIIGTSVLNLLSEI